MAGNTWTTAEGTVIDLDSGTRTHTNGYVEQLGEGTKYMLQQQLNNTQTNTNDPFYTGADRTGAVRQDGYTASGGRGSTGSSGGPVVGGTMSGGSSGSSGSSGSVAGQNPYLKKLGDAMVAQMTDNFKTSVQPQLASQSMATGGYGGSRQGVMEANANNDLQQQIGAGLANLYSSGYNSNLNYDVALRNNELGFGNLGLGYANLDRNINNDNVANQMNGVNMGLNIWDRLMGNNNTAINAGNTLNNTAMDYWSNYNNAANSLGNGFANTSSGTAPNSLTSAMGGAVMGGNIGSQLGNWWNGGASTANTAGLNAANNSGTGLDGFVNSMNGWGTMG